MPRKTKIAIAAAALGRKGGSAGTEAQNNARRTNGLSGGRPVKLRTVMGVEVHPGAKLAGSSFLEGRPVFVATSPTAARWLARHGYVWGPYPFNDEPLIELPRGGVWQKDRRR